MLSVYTTLIHFRWLKWKSGLNKTFLRKVEHFRTNDIEYNEFKLLNGSFVRRTTNAFKPNKKGRVTFFGSKITLVNLKLNDAGYYTCLASNQVGSDSVSVYLNVLPTSSATGTLLVSKRQQNNKNKAVQFILCILSGQGKGFQAPYERVFAKFLWDDKTL